MVLVGAGGVNHGELVELAEKHFSSLPFPPPPIPSLLAAFPTPDRLSWVRKFVFVMTTYLLPILPLPLRVSAGALPITSL